jgi:hypothetical protein
VKAEWDGRGPELGLRGRVAKGLLRFPERDVDEAEVRVWREAPVKPCGEVALLRTKELALALPAVEERLVLSVRHLERVDQDD